MSMEQASQSSDHKPEDLSLITDEIRQRTPLQSSNNQENELNSSSATEQTPQKIDNSSNNDPILNSDPQTNQDTEQERIVRHIMVIGFHHKHGYQVDYCYPPLEPDGPTFSTDSKQISLPTCWKTLPLLCLPDGSHNYDSDTIYFTMPDTVKEKTPVETSHPSTATSTETSHSQKLNSDQQESHSMDSAASSGQPGVRTIFGTACYRQIQADKLLNRTDDMTRFVVQKSVCVLSTKPLFGLIRSKLEMITHAYFEELDFSKVQILRQTYDNLNSLLARDSVKENGIFLGLSVRQLIAQFGCNVLVLFKAILLERKILFYKSPVRDLCTTIMSMCSLYTGLLEDGGLDYSSCDLQLSPVILEALKLLAPQEPNEGSQNENSLEALGQPAREDKVFFSPSKDEVVIISSENSFIDSEEGNDNRQNSPPAGGGDPKSQSLDSKQDLKVRKEKKKKRSLVHLRGGPKSQVSSSPLTTGSSCYQIDNQSSGQYEIIANPDDEFDDQGDPCSSSSSSTSDDDDDADSDEIDDYLAEGSVVNDPQALRLCRQKPADCGLPLQVFTHGCFCLPYLSISYLDLLADKRVKGYVIGATNFLFKQRSDIYDIIVDMESEMGTASATTTPVSISINDSNLKRCLSLSTEDLRFMDYLMKNVKIDSIQEPRDEFDLISQDVTKWIGGDEWIRYHFRLYTLYLLKAASSSGASAAATDSFNSSFIQAWRKTANYRIWEQTGKLGQLEAMQARHPLSSQGPSKGLNLKDMRLKLSYAVNSSEKGRILNQTLNGIGKWSIWGNIASAASSAASAASSAAASSTLPTLISTTINSSVNSALSTNTGSTSARHSSSPGSVDTNKPQPTDNIDNSDSSGAKRRV